MGTSSKKIEIVNASSLFIVTLFRFPIENILCFELTVTYLDFSTPKLKSKTEIRPQVKSQHMQFGHHGRERCQTDVKINEYVNQNVKNNQITPSGIFFLLIMNILF